MSNRAARRAAKKKQKSPKSIPATLQDVERAKNHGRDEAFSMSVAIILSALLDGEFLAPDEMKPAWDRINYLSDSIIKGYINPSDLIHTLRVEYDIYV